jgi:hypothetical protein
MLGASMYLHSSGQPLGKGFSSGHSKYKGTAGLINMRFLSQQFWVATKTKGAAVVISQ